jgi:L-alanine-DL-glutamate epimerase-like enolase superfamily enzyme
VRQHQLENRQGEGGRDRESDPARVRAAREVISHDTELFVDANGAWTRS